jgi:hypothetical protein
MPAVLRYVRSTLRKPRTNQRVRLSATVAPAPSSVFNLTSNFGNYARVSARDGILRFAYSHLPTPPFEFEGELTGIQQASEPRFCFTPQQTIILLYVRSGSVYDRVSTDDGKSWTAETLYVLGGTHPDISANAEGTILRTWYFGGAIGAARLYAGEAVPSDTFNLKDSSLVDLIVADDSHRIVCDLRGVWWLHVRISAAAATSLWYSTDDGETWSPTSGAVTGITSGTHPGLTIGHDGTLWAWARVGTGIQFSRRYPGDTAWSSPATVLDQAAATLTTKDIPSSMALAWEGPQRLLLATIYSTHVGPSDWFGASDGANFQQFT